MVSVAITLTRTTCGGVLSGLLASIEFCTPGVPPFELLEARQLSIPAQGFEGSICSKL